MYTEKMDGFVNQINQNQIIIANILRKSNFIPSKSYNPNSESDQQ